MVIVNNYDRARNLLSEISAKCYNSHITYDNYDSIMTFYKEVGHTFLQLLSSFPNNEDFYTFCVNEKCNRNFLGERRGVLSFITHILQDYELFPNLIQIRLYQEKEYDNKKRLKLQRENDIFTSKKMAFDSRVTRENAVNIRMMTGTAYPSDETFVRITREEYDNMERMQRDNDMGYMFSSTEEIEESMEHLKDSSNNYQRLVTLVNSKIDVMINRDEIDKAKTLFRMIIRIRELDNGCGSRIDTSEFNSDQLQRHSDAIRLHLSFILALNNMLEHLLFVHP